MCIFASSNNNNKDSKTNQHSKMDERKFNSIATAIEDKLIENFDYWKRTSSAILSKGKYVVEAYYDQITGEVDIDIFGDALGCELYNVQGAVMAAISTEKIDNEVRLEELRSDIEYEAELDHRWHLNMMR